MSGASGRLAVLRLRELPCWGLATGGVLWDA